jgi:hypothetical protein
MIFQIIPKLNHLSAGGRAIERRGGPETSLKIDGVHGQSDQWDIRGYMSYREPVNGTRSSI